MTVEICKLSKRIGAEATGVDLGVPLEPRVRRQLNEAFVANSVLVIRDQHLSPHQMVLAVQNFGDIFQQHNTRFALQECPQIHYVSNQDRFEDGTRYIPGEGYHTDHSNAAEPPKARSNCPMKAVIRSSSIWQTHMRLYRMT